MLICLMAYESEPAKFVTFAQRRTASGRDEATRLKRNLTP